MTRKEATTYTGTVKSPFPSIYPVKKDACPQDYPTADLQPTAVSVLDSINRYYYTLSGAGREEITPSMNDCFAIQLALLLISIISGTRFRTDDDGSFSEVFYRHCLKKADESGLSNEINDRDILLISIKQCLHIMTAAGILKRGHGRGVIDPATLNEGAMHQRLFNAFWNLTPWEEIFPSDPEAARELSLDRSILKDLLARHNGAVTIESIANEFFEMTGFSPPHDMEMISFLDFYFFAWMGHFGVLRYLNGPPGEPVRIAVTGAGRNILRSYS